MRRILNLIGDNFDKEAKKNLEKIASVEYMTPTYEELKKIINKYDGLIIGLKYQLDATLLKETNRLKFIATATTGLDHIDLNFALKKGIRILSLKDENEFLNTITGTAELSLGLMISLVRKIPFAFQSVMQNQWKREQFIGNNLFGKTLGIIGYGRLGKMMANYGEALGMKIIFYDPYKTSQNSFHKSVQFDVLIQNSDIISIHTHLTNETRYMINRKIFSKMKKGVFIINTSRGQIVNENDLIQFLKKKHIGGYAADVLDGELEFCENVEHPLIEYAKKNNNVIIVPHIGGMTIESRSNTDRFIAKKVIDFLKTNIK